MLENSDSKNGAASQISIPAKTSNAGIIKSILIVSLDIIKPLVDMKSFFTILIISVIFSQCFLVFFRR